MNYKNILKAAGQCKCALDVNVQECEEISGHSMLSFLCAGRVLRFLLCIKGDKIHTLLIVCINAIHA